MNTDYDPNRYGKPPGRIYHFTTQERDDLLQALSGALELVEDLDYATIPSARLAGQLCAQAERLKALRKKLSSR